MNRRPDPARNRQTPATRGRGPAAPSRLRAADAVRGALRNISARPWRAALSALGIAVGIGAGVSVVAISQSARAGLLAELGQEANLLTVAAGTTIDGTPAPLPVTAPGMIGRIPPVYAVSAVGYVEGATVRRTAAVPVADSGGISVVATDTNLLSTLGGRVARGAFLNAATATYPAVVLGAVAARTLGIASVAPGTQVYLDNRYFTVVGVLAPVPLGPEIDEAALVGFPVADSLLDLGGHPTRIYLRAAPDQVPAVASVLPFTANPVQPEALQVSRPSDVLAARIATRSALNGLLLGLGGVAVLVGGIGIANIMVISVLERRSEIGLRRALGATRAHVAAQFVIESVLLSALGGAGGGVLGAIAGAGYALGTGRPPTVPWVAVTFGLAAAVTIGAGAGVYPASRAARLSPTDALRGS